MSPWKWWFAIAGTAIIAGGVAWLFKLGAIVATDGRVVATGAAATFLELGLGLLMVGSTGVGVRLAMNQEPSMRVVLALASSLAFFLAVVVFLVHRVRTRSHWAHHRRRGGAWLPARRRRDLPLSGGRARGRDMARGRRGATRSNPGYTRRFGQPTSRVPTEGTLSALPTSTHPATPVFVHMHRSAWKVNSANFALRGF